MTVLAHNVVPEDGVPVIIEDDTFFPFEPGERERDWHEASPEEYQKYRDHYEREE